MTIVQRLACLCLAISLGTSATQAQVEQPSAEEWKHALSLFDSVKYPAGFKHFDYVNPDAPKGGLLRLSASGGYDSFNLAIPRGVVPAGLGQIYETLMVEAQDEVSTEYGLLAEAVKHPADYSSVTYRLRPVARWHDGKRLTVEDVVWSFDVLKNNSPFYAQYYRNVTNVETSGDREVTFTFAEKGNRELPQIIGQLVVLPKHWWTGTGPDGKPRDITQTTLEPPLGSGAYRIKAGFQPGRTISYERVPDYWGKDLPVMIGTNNFDEIRYDYYRDSDVALEAFKAGQYDFRIEATAKNWATAYDFPARHQGKVVLDTYPVRNMGLMQAFVFNTRREKFHDARLRRAFDLVMNFEDMNKTLFFGQYTRITSYFQNTELASSGLPEGKELEILNTVKDEVPPEVFTTPYFHPSNADNSAQRENLREAVRLMGEAGWSVKNTGGKRVLSNAKGEPLSLEVLLNDPRFERVALFYRQSLERLGVNMTVRVVDDAQYERRVRSFDFDMIIGSWAQTLSPGNEQREFWGSAAADREGSRNLVGIKNPAIDKLIERLIYATDRDDLVAATKALDRVLLWNHYVVPNWTLDKTRYAYWNRFSRPEKLPEYSLGFPDIWWYDGAKAASVGGTQ